MTSLSPIVSVNNTHFEEGSSISEYEISGSFDVTVAVIMISNVIQESILVRCNAAAIERRSVG